MANQLEFEGPVLEELLERVRAEVGPDARIVAANRVRKGGIGGFFARQAYEVLVEPAASLARTEPDQPAAATPPAVSEARVAATILELAEAVSEHERSHVIDLVEERRVSTESRDFAQVLDRFSRTIDATPDELEGADERAHPSDRETAASTARAATNVGEIDLRDPEQHVDREVSVADMPVPGEPVDPPVSRPAAGTSAGDTTRPAPRERRVATPPAIIDRYETRLSRLGLPARLIPRGVGQHGLKGALFESLTRLPAAPTVPAGLGVVIAIAGVGAAPVLLARELATDLMLDPDDIVLATREPLGNGIPAWLQMTDPATAQERRRSWRRRTRPTIVACSLQSASALGWAREMLDHLEPTITWAIVDAGGKREDLAHRVDALGGVDVLALDALDETVSPASVLELGIPVGRLEHEHASPLTWTELLLERLS